MARNAPHQTIHGDGMGGQKHNILQSNAASNAIEGVNRKSKVKNSANGGQPTNSSSFTDDEAGADEDDSSADEASEDASDKPDALALPSVSLRLAGPHQGDTKETVSRIGMQKHGRDSPQADAGASDDETDDDDYTGVDRLGDEEDSGAEEDEPNVLRAAEKDLIQEFERTEQRRSANIMTMDFTDMMLHEAGHSTPSLPTQVSDSSTLFNMNDDPFVGLASNDSLYQEMWNDAEDALAMWRLPVDAREPSADSSSVKKRVRFEEVNTHSRSTSMSSSEDPNEVFPDLFEAADEPVSLHRLVGSGILSPEIPVQRDYSDAESCYDFEGEEERLALMIEAETDSDDDDDDVDDDDAMSDFDSDDDGDTTDEETEEEAVARMLELQKPSSRASSDTPSTPASSKRALSVPLGSQNARRLSTPRSGNAPVAGTFVLDPSRAAMSADATGKNVKLFPPSKPLAKDRAFWQRARTAASGPYTGPKSVSSFHLRTSSHDSTPARPFTAESTLGSMFNGNLDILRNNDVSGIVDLLPLMQTRPHNNSLASTSFTEDSDAEVSDINMQDFLDMDDDESDSDETLSTPVDSATKSDTMDAFNTPLKARRDVSGAGLLSHLHQQRGLVGSFRRNQHQAKHVSSLAIHPATRASTSETNALQKGRRAAANTPMTPARKKRASQDFTLTGAGVKKSVSTPLSARRPRSRGASLSANGMHETLGQSIMQ